VKTGYAALFGLVVAYSAYQGTGSLKTDVSQVLPIASRDSSKTIESARLAPLSAGAEPFPTISGGICRLAPSDNRNAPCGNCKAICPAKDLGELIESYFGTDPGGDAQYLATHWNVPRQKQGNIKFVIASLPDPVHTHMALLFDRGIETIQGAAQANGYLFSRAWMPWDISPHSESTDFTVRMAQEEFRDRRESLPGLMIFQKSPSHDNDAAASILFVFVVGETPTGGLRIEQFQNALNIRQGILADAKPNPIEDEATVLRIYGPSFSGSLLSLDAILNALPHDRFSTILIRSGTISSFRAVHEFCESIRREWPDSKAGSDSQARTVYGRPDFATFQFSDLYQEYYLSVFFSARNHLHSRMAILSEDETAFGNQEPRTSGTDEQLTTSDPCVAKPPKPEFSFVRLYFPREIAQLRDAYQQDLKSQSTAGGAKETAQSGLPLSLGVTGNDDDSVAPYSPLQTPLSQESILQGIVATLRKEHARLVLIRGADPLDVVFLSRYLRQNYPQARLVTVGADLLMIHDFYDPRFHGILAVSPYPLLTGAQFPFLTDAQFPSLDRAKKEVHRLFPDSSAVGGFNAFQALFAPTVITDAGRSLPPAEYEQFGLPSFLQPKGGDAEPWRAHLWLAAVGREGYWPVAVLDDLTGSDLKEAKPAQPSILPANAMHIAPPPPYSVHFSVGWTIFWMSTFGLTVLLALLLAFPPDFPRTEIIGRFGGQMMGSNREHASTLDHPSHSALLSQHSRLSDRDFHDARVRNGLLFTGSMLLLASQTLFLFPAVVWLGRFGRGESEQLSKVHDLWDGLGLVMACFLISAIGLGIACYRGFRKRGSRLLAQAGASVCGAAVVVTLLLTSSLWSRNLGTSLGAFTYRYINIGSGVSPSLPLLFLLAAWMWWCWQSLTGITSTEEKHMVLPDANDFNLTVVPKASERMRLKALATRGEWPWKSLEVLPFTGKIAIPALAGLLVIFLLMQPSEIAEAFESRTYKVIYWVLLYSCLLLVCYLVAQIVALWLEFRALLRAIERLAFRRGFSDLKSMTWKPLWKLAGNGRQEFVQLFGGEVDALTQIENSGIPVGTLATAIGEAKTATDKVSAAYEGLVSGKAGDSKTADVHQLFHDLQTKLAKAASEALIYASKQWTKEAYTAVETKPDATVEPPAKAPCTRAVEHFLCLFYLNIILVPLRRLQTLILAMAGVFVFVLISYSSYPFESRESFHVLLISVFFAISLVVGLVYGQMYADPLLSRITNTKPGELGLDFWVRLGTFVFIPLVSLLSVQFPEVNNFLFSWLQPALQSVK
jgi:hypothetical protein